MVQLSGLPNELLGHILGYVMPEDLENLAQVSRHIRSVSGSALEDHHRLIRKYTLFSGPAAAETVEPLLKDVFANLRIGHYVKRIELCEVLREESEDEGGDEQENEMEEVDMEDGVDRCREELSLDQIHAAVDENKLLHPQHRRWINERIDKGKRDILIALLLPLLPNLTVLSIAHKAYLAELYMMIERAPKIHARFLSKLEQVHIQAYDYEQNSEHFMLDHLKAFLPLPSLRRLSGMRVWQNGWRRELLEPPQISNVTDLDMRECAIGSKLLDQFLRSFPHLQSFVYTSFYEGYPNGDEFDPFVIRAALQARVSNTLRKLTILTNLTNALEDEKTFMGPLCGFQVLEYVHSDWSCLVPYVGADVRGDEREILSLILPKSLRVLSLRNHDQFYESNHRELIDHAIQAKRDPEVRLPLLETLIFTMAPEIASAAQEELRDGDDQGLQQRCDVVGLSLRFNT
ncbi:MAG: hypothetical protein Q9161_002865 [Pseudevernia consocians]